MSTNAAAARAFRAGRLSEAALLLEQNGIHSADDAVLSSELLYLRGQSSSGAIGAETSLAEHNLPLTLKSRCLSVMAAFEFDRGQSRRSVGDAVAKQWPLPTRPEMRRSPPSQQLSCWSAVAIKLGSMLLCQWQRKFDAERCDATDLQVRATVHLTFGRLEARVGHLHTALRHFAVGRQFIADDPNDLLASSIDLDESSVLSLLGDVPGALDMAQRAAKSAAASGWAKGKRVAALNVAQFLVSLGRLSEVDAHLKLAREQAFQSVTYDVGLAETQAQVAYCRGLYEAAEDVLANAARLSDGVPQWYRLTNQVTRNRLLIRLGRFREAVENATECIVNAERSAAEHLVTTFRIQHAEALVGLGPAGRRLRDRSVVHFNCWRAALSYWLAAFGQCEGVASRGAQSSVARSALALP